MSEPLVRLFKVAEDLPEVPEDTRVTITKYLFGNTTCPGDLDVIVKMFYKCVCALRTNRQTWSPSEEQYLSNVQKLCALLPMFQHHAGARRSLIDAIVGLFDALYLLIKD